MPLTKLCTNDTIKTEIMNCFKLIIDQGKSIVHQNDDLCRKLDELPMPCFSHTPMYSAQNQSVLILRFLFARYC